MEKLTVFVVPGENFVNGGVMSFHYHAKYSRNLCDEPSSATLLVSVADEPTHFINQGFKSNERVVSPSLVCEHFEKIGFLTVHVPPVYIQAFKESLLSSNRFLGKAEDIRINILNQNNRNMPAPENLAWMFDLGRVTQTVAFEANCNSLQAEKYKMPVHLMAPRADRRDYKAVDINDKTTRIFVSPDRNVARDSIIEELKKTGITVFEWSTMPYEQYRKEIAKSKYVITLGEGFDGYFVEGFYTGAVVFAVYDKDFFPSKKFKDFETIFSSYDELIAGITEAIKRFEADDDLYREYIDKVANEISACYRPEDYHRNVKEFMAEDYHVVP